MKNKTLYITQSALIAAIYVVLVFVFKSISFTHIQIRLAEALTILPYFTPAGIPGVSIGCLLANFLNGADVLDTIFGSLATLIGAVGSYLLRRNKFLVPLPPILANSLIIPWVLRYAYGSPFTIPFLTLTVGIGEVIFCGILGLLLIAVLSKHKNTIFKLT